MARASSGGVVEKQTSRGTSYALRFRALGKRQFVHVGYAADGVTREDAERELGYVLEQVRRGVWQQPADPVRAEAPREVPTFHEFASDWFAAQKLEGGRKGKGLSKAGAEDLQWRLSCHLLPVFASKRLDQITVEDVDRYRRRKVAEGRIGATSINKTLTTLASILETAVEYELIPRNVAKGRRRRLPTAQPRRTWLNRAEHIVALLNAAGELDKTARYNRGQRRALLATLVYAGPRIGEALALRWRDVDLARGVIRIRDGKTDAAARTVYLLPALRDELAAYRSRFRDVDAGALVFGTTTGEKHSTTNVRRRVLARAVALANDALAAEGDGELLPARLTPHSLRRTFASLLFAVGEAPPYVMGQMGHTTASLTLAIYAREMDRRDGEPERLRALVNGEEWAPAGTNGDVTVPDSPAQLAA